VVTATSRGENQNDQQADRTQRGRGRRHPFLLALASQIRDNPDLMVVVSVELRQARIRVDEVGAAG
jgi:hypothetical protein